jgi:polyferredoxin
MKKIAPYVILFILAMVVWDAMLLDAGNMHMVFGEEELDGPLGALLGLAVAGGGLLIGFVVLVLAGIVLTVVFASVGVLLMVGLAIGAVVLALAVSPLLLPILIPLAIFWYFANRNKTRRLKAQQEVTA